MAKCAKPFAGSSRRGGWGRAAVAALVAAATLALPASALAQRIRGKVTGFRQLLNPVWDEARASERHLYSFREPVPTVPSELRRLFPHIPKELCVAILAEEKQPPQKPILIRVGGGRTTPVTIVVTPGTQLQFQNTDPFTHELYGVGIKTFGPAETRKGGTRTWTVPGPGTFEIRDKAAPSLRMWVIGEPKVAGIAYPSMSGDFVITAPGPGAYTVQAYFAGQTVGKARPVTVDRDVDLSRQPIDVKPAKTVAAATEGK